MAATAWTPASHGVALGAGAPIARAPETKNHAPYPDSAKGLKQQLEDMRELARSGSSDQLQAMISDLKFPDPRTWYLANFGTSGLETATVYENTIKASEKWLNIHMFEFARENGYFSVRKQDAKKVHPSMVTAPEVFLAVWERTSLYGEHSEGSSFGYFFFVDGKFRWDSTLTWVSVD